MSAALIEEREFNLYPHQEIELLAHEFYDVIIHIGGKGSGKTVGLVCWILDRGVWDTAQEHALFTYTALQREQVLQRIYPLLEQCGVTHAWNSRPPDAWIERWKRDGIPLPPTRDRFTNAITFSTGLRVQTGTLFNESWEQYQGPEWGSIAFEEFTTGPEQVAIENVMDRARCGMLEDFCRAHHRHTKILHGNPPEDDGHWSFDWLKRLDSIAANSPGGIASEADDTYPNLMNGVGSILYIQSASDDNPRQRVYAQNIRDRVDDVTAARRLGGEMRRRRTGLAYSSFSRENEHPVWYRNDRTIYVSMDFNNRPIVAGLHHPLIPGEFPGEHAISGISHVGKFGEVFDTKGGGLQTLCSLLLSGDLGDRGHVPPPPYSDGKSEWRGLLEHKGKVVFFGDPTGSNRSASGQSLWDIVDDFVIKQLRQRGITCSKNIGPITLVPVRIRATNAKFCSSGSPPIRSFWVAPWLTQSITDYTSVVWEKHKPDVQKYGERGGGERWMLTHSSDGDSYMLSTLFPLGNEISSNPADSLPKLGGLDDRIQVPRMRI